ncbi:hypothetical protein HK405_002708, partial [Cladochytrium tenue]
SSAPSPRTSTTHTSTPSTCCSRHNARRYGQATPAPNMAPVIQTPASRLTTSPPTPTSWRTGPRRSGSSPGCSHRPGFWIRIFRKRRCCARCGQCAYGATVASVSATRWRTPARSPNHPLQPLPSATDAQRPWPCSRTWMSDSTIRSGCCGRRRTRTCRRGRPTSCRAGSRRMTTAVAAAMRPGPLRLTTITATTTTTTSRAPMSATSAYRRSAAQRSSARMMRSSSCRRCRRRWRGRRRRCRLARGASRRGCCGSLSKPGCAGATRARTCACGTSTVVT